MNIRKYLLPGVAILLVLGLFSACSGKKEKPEVVEQEVNIYTARQQEVNIYTARHYDIDDKIYNDFTAKTGIKVNVISGNAPEILGRLNSEGADTSADIFITADIANLYKAVEADIVIPINSDIINANIPERLRGEGNIWVALTERARIIAYDKTKTDPATLSTYAALTDEQLKGKILVRGASSGYNQSLVASIIAETSEEEAVKWATGIVANMARTPKGNDRDQAKAVIAGEGDLAILNTYYIGRMLYSDDPEEVKVAEAISVFFPEKTHINISGVTLIKYSKNQENAIQLIEYLTSPEVQTQYTNENYEYPANKSVEPHELLTSFGPYVVQDVSLTDIGKNSSKASKVFGEAGWK